MGGAIFVPRNFTQLDDAPSTLTGQARKRVRVKSDETALEFYSPELIDIRDYGAVSGADSSTAINAALAAGSILIPPGIFWVDASIIAETNRMLWGCGPESILKAKANLNAAMISGTSKDKIVLNNFLLDGNQANQTSSAATGISLNGCTRVRMVYMYLTACYGHAIWIYGGSNRIKVLDSDIYDTGVASANPPRGIYSYKSRKVEFCHNTIIAANGFGITAQESSEVVINENDIEDSVNYDGMIIYNCFDVTINGNNIRNCFDSGIVLELCSEYTCNGNTIERAGYVGIYLVGSSYGTVNGNVLRDNGQNNHATFRHDIILNPSSTVSTWTASTVKALDAIVKPTTPNGFYYKCTTAGTTGASEPGAWPTTKNTTVTDGTVVWTAYPLNATHNNVSGNVCVSTTPIRTRYGIEEQTASDDYNVITNNQCFGQSIAGVQKRGANSVAANNL
mgnify:CR=1 FL=1